MASPSARIASAAANRAAAAVETRPAAIGRVGRLTRSSATSARSFATFAAATTSAATIAARNTGSVASSARPPTCAPTTTAMPAATSLCGRVRRTNRAVEAAATAIHRRVERVAQAIDPGSHACVSNGRLKAAIVIAIQAGVATPAMRAIGTSSPATRWSSPADSRYFVATRPRCRGEDRTEHAIGTAATAAPPTAMAAAASATSSPSSAQAYRYTLAGMTRPPPTPMPAPRRRAVVGTSRASRRRDRGSPHGRRSPAR